MGHHECRIYFTGTARSTTYVVQAMDVAVIPCQAVSRYSKQRFSIPHSTTTGETCKAKRPTVHVRKEHHAFGFSRTLPHFGSSGSCAPECSSSSTSFSSSFELLVLSRSVYFSHPRLRRQSSRGRTSSGHEMRGAPFGGRTTRWRMA